MKAPRHHIYIYGLLFFIVGVILTATGLIEDRGLNVFGFFVFLIAFLNTLDKALLFRNIKPELWLLLGYVAVITVLIYIFYPYAANKETLRSLWYKWHVQLLAAAGNAPALIAKALRGLFDLPLPYAFTKPRTHYPFAFGFWLLYLLLSISVRLYERVGRRTPMPMLYLILSYHFIIGGITAIWWREIGVVMMGMSVVVWCYLYFPRFGIPTIFKTRRRQREIRRAGKDIQRAQDRMEKIMHKIDRI